MHRRSLLATTAAGVVALAGCTETAAPGADTATPTDVLTTEPSADPTPTVTSARTAEVTVGRVVLQYGLVTPTSPDSIGVRDPETPYVVASVTVDGALPREAFALRVGERSVAPTTVDRLYRTAWGDDGWYRRDRRSGLLLFEPPQGAADDLRLTWPDGERHLDASAGARFDGPPDLSASIDAPTTYAGTGTPSVGIEVTNEGDRSGRFLGALNRVGPLVAYTPVARLSGLVPAGERVTIPVSDGWGGRPPADRVGDGDPDVTYHLGYTGRVDSAEIRVVESDSS